jgi:hypothetical protein
VPAAESCFAEWGVYVARVSRGFAGRFLECPEMPGNKREQNATRRDMKFATIGNKLLILLCGRGERR